MGPVRLDVPRRPGRGVPLFTPAVYHFSAIGYGIDVDGRSSVRQAGPILWVPPLASPPLAP